MNKHEFRAIWRLWGTQVLFENGKLQGAPDSWYRSCRIGGKKWWTSSRFPPMEVIIRREVEYRQLPRIEPRQRRPAPPPAPPADYAERRRRFTARNRDRALAACAGILLSLDEKPPLPMKPEIPDGPFRRLMETLARR